MCFDFIIVCISVYCVFYFLSNKNFWDYFFLKERFVIDGFFLFVFCYFIGSVD